MEQTERKVQTENGGDWRATCIGVGMREVFELLENRWSGGRR